MVEFAETFDTMRMRNGRNRNSKVSNWLKPLTIVELQLRVIDLSIRREFHASIDFAMKNTKEKTLNGSHMDKMCLP